MQSALHAQSIFVAVSLSATAGHLPYSAPELRRAATTTSVP
jgi:hypothetical protein